MLVLTNFSSIKLGTWFQVHVTSLYTGKWHGHNFATCDRYRGMRITHVKRTWIDECIEILIYATCLEKK